MPGRTFSSGSYRYGFNGKESDNEVKGEGNQQDYGLRIFDPRLVRFLSIDPLTRKYPELTPYQFASNRPIDGIDLDGGEHYNYRLTLANGVPKLELMSVQKYGSLLWFKWKLPEIHNIDYNGSSYSFLGGEVNLSLSNERGTIFSFVDNPEKAIKDGTVKSNAALKVDWYVFNLQQEVLEFTAAQSTFALKTSSSRVASGAKVGNATSDDYRATFFEANPNLKGKVVVHHAVEQQVKKRYPSLFTNPQIQSLENLRGIPLSDNNVIHLSIIRRLWNSFYKANPNATVQDVLNEATKIDGNYGHLFNPAINRVNQQAQGAGGFNFARGLILLTGLQTKENNSSKEKTKKPG